MEWLLNDCKWEVKGVYPYNPIINKCVETGADLMGVTDWIPAAVPGGVHQDLYRSGLLEDAYYEMNSLKCEWVENRWWMFRTAFTVPSEMLGRHISLHFKGVDYKAFFALNGSHLGEHEGMYDEIEFAINPYLKPDEENELLVIVQNAPEEMRQIGYTSKTRTQKSRFNYKWDFGTRMVNLGIWDDVFLKATGPLRLDDLHIRTTTDRNRGIIDIGFNVNALQFITGEAKISLYDGDALADRQSISKIWLTGSNSVNVIFELEHPKLWWPNGAGDQPLYRIVIEIFAADALSDSRSAEAGIRKLEYEQNENAPEGALPYTFVVNGEKVYIKGVNITPFDHQYGTVTKETYTRYVQLMKAAHINLVRVWGGGIIEKEFFYELCDRAGIMIWQEFIQSGSGIENVPSMDPHFIALMRKTASSAVKIKRNHVSLSVWSGGNELTEADGTPVSYANPNIGILKKIVNDLDPDRLFLPSSASGPNEFIFVEQVGQGRHHDVHGNWIYMGIEGHYNYYNLSDSLFHSEFGVNGMSNYKSLQKFVAPENLKVTNAKTNLTWRHHGEWWDSSERDIGMFGPIDTLQQLVKCSQWVQAEGLRYILEANRRRKYNNSGSIIWQFNEPWPNLACTSLIDYYGLPKMAYYWTRSAFAPVTASLSYGRLDIGPETNWKGQVYVHNSLSSPQSINITIEFLDEKGQSYYEETLETVAAANRSTPIKDLDVKVPTLKRGIYFVRLTTVVGERELCKNVYVFSQLAEHHFAPLLQFDQGRLQIIREGRSYKIKNVGEDVCLFVGGTSSVDDREAFIEHNYDTLFPGEEQVFTVNEDVEIAWECMNPTAAPVILTEQDTLQL